MPKANKKSENDQPVSVARATNEFRGDTADAFDPAIGWTAQSGEGYAVDPNTELPGQMFVRSQLPDPEIAKAAGLRPQTVPEYLILDDEEAYAHPQGPEPGELVRAAKRDEVKRGLFEQANLDLDKAKKDAEEDADKNQLPVAKANRDSIADATAKGATVETNGDEAAEKAVEVGKENRGKGDTGDKADAEKAVDSSDDKPQSVTQATAKE